MYQNGQRRFTLRQKLVANGRCMRRIHFRSAGTRNRQYAATHAWRQRTLPRRDGDIRSCRGPRNHGGHPIRYERQHIMPQRLVPSESESYLMKDHPERMRLASQPAAKRNIHSVPSEGMWNIFWTAIRTGFGSRSKSTSSAERDSPSNAGSRCTVTGLGISAESASHRRVHTCTASPALASSSATRCV